MAYSTRSPAVKRLMKEAQELSEPTELFFAQPLEDNLFEWHFTIRGPGDTEFEGGIYHGRILLPTDYPMKPPNIMLLTPNGRFDVNRKICLSISGYHPESWRPSWSIRTAMLAIIGFMPTHGSGAIGSLDYPAEERKRLAKASQEFRCNDCGETKSILHALTEASKRDTEEAKDLATQIDFKAQTEKAGDASSKDASTPGASAPAVSADTTPAPSNVPPPSAAPPAPQQVPFTFTQWLEEFKGYVRQAQQPAVVAGDTPAVAPPVVQQAAGTIQDTAVHEGGGPTSQDSYLVWSLALVVALLVAIVARRLIETFIQV